MDLTMFFTFGLMIVILEIGHSQSGEILDDLASFKDSLLGGLFGKAKCGCACRDYYVPKCEITYVEQCRYEHYEQVCDQVPVPVARQAKETECQKCRKYYETVPVVKYVKECVPVYDEKCHTDYHQHCKTETRCVMIYQTVCGPGGVGLETSYGYNRKKRNGYGSEQHCQSQPRQHCYPETKCHRTPNTQCIPVQKENCAKVPKDTTEQRERKECLAFEMTAAQLEEMHRYDPCAQYQTGYGAPQQQAQGYQAPDHHHQQSPHVTTNYAAPNQQYTTPHVDQHQQQQQQQHQHGSHFQDNQHQAPPVFIQSDRLSDQQSSQQFRQAPVIQQESPFPALPSLPAYDGPDPLYELHQGFENLFNVKRESTVVLKSSTVGQNSSTRKSETNEEVETKTENPFLKGRLPQVQFDEEGWIPLVASAP